MKTEKVTAIHANEALRILSGKVESTGPDGYRIQGPDGNCQATRAFGCLVEPRVGDVVLFSIDERFRGHVLTVLERPQGDRSDLVFPGDVTLRSERGEVNLDGGQGINISSPGQINIMSEEYTLSARQGLVNVESLTAIGASLVSHITQVQTFAQNIETVARHWLQKLTNSFRQVEGVDQLRTKDSLHTVENLYSMRSRQAAILAKKDIKMDAERIHMG